jgi:hypothetical protein
MGAVGQSVRSIFRDVLSGDDVLRFLSRVTPDSHVEVLHEDGTWGVLTGDQLLFVGQTRGECDDFLLGLVVGAALFPDLATSFPGGPSE